MAVGPNLQLRILELEDLVKDLRAALADREDKLASRAQASKPQQFLLQLIWNTMNAHVLWVL